MIKCPKDLSDDDRWIALSLLSLIIKSDSELNSLEISHFKEKISQALGIDASELEYFDELMSREFNPEDFDKIDAAENKIIAKHILKEAMHISFIDGDCSEYEMDIIKRWSDRNDLEPTFIDDLKAYIALMVSEDADEDMIKKADAMGEDLLNSTQSSDDTHGFFSNIVV